MNQSTLPLSFRMAVLVLAAGESTRFGGNTPKPYVKNGDSSIIKQVLNKFLQHSSIALVQPVIAAAHAAHFNAAMEGISLPRLLAPVHGGEVRQESVRLGLAALASLPQPPTHVLVHDCARAWVDNATIDRVITALQAGTKAVVPVIAVVDTIRAVKENTTLDRANLRAVQTPQGFDFPLLLELHQTFAGREFTDDAQLAEAAKIPVQLVEGSPQNRKLTTSDDLKGMFPMQTQIGSGFDVHAFRARAQNEPLMRLCGVEIESEWTLDGHSDADAGLHALTDALLGAAGLPDIGTFFPPTDAQWKGADSALFVRHAVQKIAEKNGRIVHVDITFMCEMPRITPHRESMRTRVAQLLNIPLTAVSIKATTTEGLGFLGRREGLAAHALVTLEFPRTYLGE